MIESSLPRTPNNLPPGVASSSTCPPGSSDTCDPINGREWDTKKGALQYACVFQLQQPRDCSPVPGPGPYCACAAGQPAQNTPLCQNSGGTYTPTQINAAAFPAVSEMVIAHAMGPQGIVSSICPIHTTPANGDIPPDPLFGYRPGMTAIVNRIRVSLGE
jgi:hypothetical protein